MRLNILCDAHWESRVDRVLDDELFNGYRQFFAERDYGSGLVAIVVVLMCRDPAANFKRRIRLKRKVRTLYMDIMLDLEIMREIDDRGRKELVVRRLQEEIPEVLRTYSIRDFDDARFIFDLVEWLRSRL